MPEEQTSPTEQVTEPSAPVTAPKSEAAPETADSNTTETTEAKSPEQPSAAPDTQTETQPEQQTQTTDDAKPAESEPTPVDKPADRIVPDARDYVLPEGVPEAMAQFAHDADMTQEQLDKSLAQFSHIVQANEQGMQEAIRQNGLAHVETWGKQKDYNLSLARRALSQNDPEGKLKEMLDVSGYSNHPAVLDFFLRIGSSMKEGGFLKGANNTQSKAGLSAAQSMFGSNHPSAN